MSKRIYFSILLVLLSGYLFAAEVSFESGVQQTVMIELYTSEGCSSCPPADKFLNGLKTNNLLWKKYLPLAFHVDYWDYIGWKDRYADPLNTRRQEQHAKVNRARTIYTPGFFVNGRSWRKGFFNSLPDANNRSIGNLRVKYSKRNISARFKPTARIANYLQLNIAILGMGLKTNITAGENEGSLSEHDFVVLGHKTVTSDKHAWNTSLPKLIDVPARSYALVAWISQKDSPVPIQATGGFIHLTTKK